MVNILDFHTINTNEIFKPYRAFGWLLHRGNIPQGTTTIWKLDDTVPRSEFGSIFFWVKGAIQIKLIGQEENVTLLRSAGDLSLDFNATLGDLWSGSFETTALEDSERWCILKRYNRLTLPNINKLVLTVSSSVELPIGTKLLICRGTGMLTGNIVVEGPQTITVTSSDIILTATTDIYGLYFT